MKVFQEGDSFGEYQLIRRFGVGGYGEVWLVKKQTDWTDAEYALKILYGRAQPNKKNIREEAKNWSDLSKHIHPNIAPFVDLVVHDEEQIGFLSHFYEEGSLRDKLGALPVDVETAVELTINILKGVQHCHSHGVIHRDLKPENILLCDGYPLLIDFGISRFIAENMSGRTMAYAGTPEYSSPNALKDGIERADDIWSVGIILYEMLEKRLPFDPDDPQLRENIQRENPRPMESNVSNTLKRIVLRALEKNQYKRFDSADDMRTALIRYKASEEARRRSKEDWDVIARRIGPGDPQEKALLDLYSDIFPDDGTVLPRELFQEMLQPDLPNRITKTHNIPLIAIRNEELLGFLTCCYYEEANMAFIPYFAVKPGVSTSFQTSKHLLEKLFKVLYFDKECDYVFFEAQIKESTDARLDRFADLSNQLGLEFRRFYIDYEGPKTSNDGAVDSELLFFGVGIKKDIDDLMDKSRVEEILEFMFTKVYGDVYPVESEEFKKHHAHLVEHLKKVTSKLSGEVETAIYTRD